MNDKLDTNALVCALTDGIGAHLGRSVRSSFFELLKRLPRVKAYSELETDAQQQVIDLLALSIFYTEVICPLGGATSFLRLLEKSNATHVRIGTDRLTRPFAIDAERCVLKFRAMLSSNKVPIGLLTFSSLNEFVSNILKYDRGLFDDSVDR